MASVPSHPAVPTPALPPAVVIGDGVDVARLWRDFEIFEALHHTMTIANPMSTSDLDRVVELLEVSNGDTVLELACGYGELLIRLAEQAAISGTGVDLSPHMLRGAVHNAASRQVSGLEWILSNAADTDPDQRWDRVACLGATWIWHGTNGTIRAVAQRTKPGGLAAIGDMVRRDEVGADQVPADYGKVEGADDYVALCAAHGFEVVDRVIMDDNAWDDYISRTGDAAAEWARLHPGPTAERYLEEQRSWVTHHERDRPILTWMVWVLRRTT